MNRVESRNNQDQVGWCVKKQPYCGLCDMRRVFVANIYQRNSKWRKDTRIFVSTCEVSDRYQIIKPLRFMLCANHNDISRLPDWTKQALLNPAWNSFQTLTLTTTNRWWSGAFGHFRRGRNGPPVSLRTFQSPAIFGLSHGRARILLKLKNIDVAWQVENIVCRLVVRTGKQWKMN
jgi:hypothetical protein